MKMSLMLLFVAVCVLFGPVSSVDREGAKGGETDLDKLWLRVWCPAETMNVGEPARLESGTSYSGDVLCLTTRNTKQACTLLKTADSARAPYTCPKLSQCTDDEYSEYKKCMSPQGYVKCCCKEENCNSAIFTAPEPTTTTIITTGKLTTITTITAKPTTTTKKPTTTTERPAITTETPTTTTTDTESATESIASATEEAPTVEEFSATTDNSKIAATPPSHEGHTRNWPLYLGVSLGVLALMGAVGAGVFILFQRKKKREALKRQAEKCSIRASVDSTYEPLSALDTRVQ